MESQVLSAILYDRSAWETLQPFINIEDFSDHGKILLHYIEIYYSRDDKAETVDPTILSRRLARDFPTSDTVLQAALDELEPVSTNNVIDDYVNLRLETIGDEIAEAVVGRETHAHVLALMEGYRDLSEFREDALVGSSGLTVSIGATSEFMVSADEERARIPMYPPELNDQLMGGLRRGDHAIVYARPEAGKSMFALSNAANSARRGYRTILFSNEDKIKALNMRLVSFFCRKSIKELYLMTDAEQEPYREEANSKGMFDVIVIEDFPGTPSMLNTLVRKYEPDMMIIDQIRNLKGPKSDNRTELLEYVAQEARNTAKRHDIAVISMTQAGDSASRMLDLTMSDIDSSKTGIPSAADLLIAIGSEEKEDDTTRKLNICKNKISNNRKPLWVDFLPDTSEIVLQDE